MNMSPSLIVSGYATAVTGTVVETHTQLAAQKNKKKTRQCMCYIFVPFIREFRANLSSLIQ